jgi:hypothetical protein
LIQQTLQETGFDLQTGRVLDPVKFQRWRQQSGKTGCDSAPAQTNGALLEVFRKARLAIESWVDDANNQELVANGAPEEISVRVQDLLRDYAAYGPELEQKLTRHLFFMIDNRRKYFQAVAKT